MKYTEYKSLCKLFNTKPVESDVWRSYNNHVMKDMIRTLVRTTPTYSEDLERKGDMRVFKENQRLYH